MDKIYFFFAIIPILITVYSFLYPTNILINYYLFTLNISAFNVIITVEVYRYLIKSKVFSEKINAKTRWVIMIYLSQIFLYLTIIFSIWNNISQPNIIIYKFLRVSSLYWIVVLLYIISNPIVFFGETKLLVKNQNNDNKSFLLWKTNTNITVSDNEQKIWEKIHPLLDNYLKVLSSQLAQESAIFAGLIAPSEIINKKSYNIGIKNGNYTVKEMAEVAGVEPAPAGSAPAMLP